MAIGLIIRLKGIGADKYDAVQKELGLDKPTSQWPDGLVSHVAGPSGRDWCVVDVYESQAHFDKFLASRLGPAGRQKSDRSTSCGRMRRRANTSGPPGASR